jgi:hypothetical protein
MHYLLKPFFLTLPLLLSLHPLFAQVEANQNLVSNWYLEERFLITDQNEDALLDKSEMRQFPKEFAYYLDNRNFELTDLNKDRKLSFNEMKRRVRTEFTFRQKQELKELRQIEQEVEQLDLSTLKAQPAVLVRLFGNLEWLYANRKLAERIIADQEWANAHPEVMLSLQRNLCWLASNPAKAKILYRNRQLTSQLPELLGWRADHKAFIRSHPKLDGIYPVLYWPEEIRVNGK